MNIAPLVLGMVLNWAADPWLTIQPGHGPAADKRVVLVSGDEEYRSEEMLPQLARILARQGFSCVVLFAVDPKDGAVCPNVTDNIPGLHHLRSADLLILFTRFRNLPDDQMRHLAAYVESGKPIIGLRTATHAFKLSDGAFHRFSWDSAEPQWEGGFGRRVLGETWISHHGIHGKEGTRGMLAPGQTAHPILRGIKPGSLFSPTDVYTVRLPLTGDAVPLVLGEVTETMDPGSAPVAAKNDPMMPVAWIRSYRVESGKTARVFTCTMASAQDLVHEGNRRLLVHAALWAVGLEDRISEGLDVSLAGRYSPSPFGFRDHAAWKPGKTPAAW